MDVAIKAEGLDRIDTGMASVVANRVTYQLPVDMVLGSAPVLNI